MKVPGSVGVKVYTLYAPGATPTWSVGIPWPRRTSEVVSASRLWSTMATGSPWVTVIVGPTRFATGASEEL